MLDLRLALLQRTCQVVQRICMAALVSFWVLGHDNQGAPLRRSVVCARDTGSANTSRGRRLCRNLHFSSVKTNKAGIVRPASFHSSFSQACKFPLSAGFLRRLCFNQYRVELV